MDMNTALGAFIDEQQLHSFEGRRGVIALCKIARALGYKDDNYYGQLDTNASIGDLINFLEDNSGAIQAVVDWITNLNDDGMVTTLCESIQELPEDDADEDDEFTEE